MRVRAPRQLSKITKKANFLTKPVGQIAGKIMRTAGDVTRDPIGVTKELYSGAGQALTLGVPTYLAGQIRGKRRDLAAKEGAEKASLAEQQAQVDKMAGQALERYQGGKLDEGTQAGIDRQAEIRKAQLREKLGQAGIGDSTTALRTEGSVEDMRLAEMDKALDTEFEKAMQLLGLDQEVTTIMQSLNREDRMERAQAYADTMRALGTIGAMVTSGGK